MIFPYVIKYIKKNEDFHDLCDTDSSAYEDYFEELSKRLPRVTEFMNTFRSKAEWPDVAV